jgi:ABC-type transport system involved in multi-copper enzyme maturation permease subunit
MKPVLKSEIRKLLTIRSTYILSGLAILLTGFLSFYALGFKVTDGTGSHVLANSLSGISGIVSIFGALIAILLMAHEYRYNTIVYTLTTASNRGKVLAAKIIAALTYSIVLSLAVGVLSFALIYLGASMGGHSLDHQEINLLVFFAKLLFVSCGYASIALLVVTLIKSIAGSIAFLFIVPNTVEGLLGLLLKDTQAYLPFTALGQVMTSTGTGTDELGRYNLSPAKGAFVFCIYLVIFWAITWIIFMRRDAN